MWRLSLPMIALFAALAHAALTGAALIATLSNGIFVTEPQSPQRELIRRIGEVILPVIGSPLFYPTLRGDWGSPYLCLAANSLLWSLLITAIVAWRRARTVHMN